ncbi:DUF488 family protein [Micromonospora sp. NPDC050276]|uniref:DUF488 family protein n=1 Tax=Micromonospora sp. NPDC050276 TaxID=3364278 RepID=UPI0037AF3C4A
MRELLTVGHGAADRVRLGELLTGAGVALVVDVRRYLASRTNPDVRREELARWLPERGVDYRWEPRLGGRRHIPAGEPQPDTWWTVAAFRAYAAYTRGASAAGRAAQPAPPGRGCPQNFRRAPVLGRLSQLARSSANFVPG